MNTFEYKRKLSIIRGDAPITFAHIKDYDSPGNHQLHINNYIEVYVYVSGDTDYIVSDKYYSLKSGDIIVITPQEVHKAVLHNNCLYERFYILVPVHMFSRFVFDPLEKMLNRSPGSPALVSLRPKERETAMNILYKVSELCRDNTDSNKLMIAYTQVIKFLCLLNENMESLSVDVFRKEHIPEIVSEVLVYIDKNLTSLQSSAEIAEHFKVTPQYLSTVFKKYIGTSIKIYIRTNRIALAKSLLNSGCSVTEACYESGFNDCSYFIKHFKQCLGVTPLQYKLNLKS